MSFLGAMGFVDETDDVVALDRFEVVHLLETLDRRDERAAPAGPQLLLQILDAERLLDIRIIASVEVVAELRFQIAPVDDNKHRRIVQRRMRRSL